MFDDLSLCNFSEEGEGVVTRRVIFGWNWAAEGLKTWPYLGQ